MKVVCDVYRSLRHQEMYLYVSKEDGLSRVPEALLGHFGPSEVALSLVLTPERRLAKENAVTVLKNLADEGYHLQMPPLHKGQLGALPGDASPQHD